MQRLLDPQQPEVVLRSVQGDTQVHMVPGRGFRGIDGSLEPLLVPRSEEGNSVSAPKSNSVADAQLRASRDSLIATMVAYGIPEAQAKIQVECLIEATRRTMGVG